MDTTVTVTSIDGDVTWPHIDALIAEAPTDWSDEGPIPIWDADGERIGAIDPDTGAVLGEYELTGAEIAAEEDATIAEADSWVRREDT